MADEALIRGEGQSGFLPWGYLTKGWGDYRLGNYSDEVRSLERAIADGPKEVQATAGGVLAMTLVKLNERDRAGSCLEAAKAIVDQIFASPEAGKPAGAGGQWWDWLIARMVVREAEVSLNAAATGLKPRAGL